MLRTTHLILTWSFFFLAGDIPEYKVPRHTSLKVSGGTGEIPIADLLHALRTRGSHYSPVPELTFDPKPHDPNHLQPDTLPQANARQLG